MTYFPKWQRVKQDMLLPSHRRHTQDEVIQAFSKEQAIEEANRCFSCGTCNACDNCYLVCPEPCIVRSVRSNGLYKILTDYCKGCRVCIEECPTGCLESVPEMDFDTGVVRMDTAFAITPGLHGQAGRGAEEPGGPSRTKTSRTGNRAEGTYGDRSCTEEESPDQRLRRAAQAAKYADVDVITAYPIRPYTATMIALAQMVANGELDAEYIVADSEHSQLSIAHGASSSGARVFTGSSGVGVQFAYELYSPISGTRMPVQMMIADRTLDPPGDFGSEHTDALSTRDMGWLMGWACDAQEAFDNHLLGYRIGEDPRVLLPQMVCQDGFFVSHITTDVELPDTGQVREFLPAYTHPYPLDPRRPVSHGPQIMPEQGPPLQLERARAMEGAVPVIEQAHEEFARIFGRRYDPWIEEYMTSDAEVVFFLQGAHGVTARYAIQHMRQRGAKVGLVRLKTIRPYPTDRVKEVLSRFAVVGVIETNMGLGSVSSGGVLYAEACAALYESAQRPLVVLVHGRDGRRGDRPERILLDDAEDARREEARKDREAHALGRVRRVGSISRISGFRRT